MSSAADREVFADAQDSTEPVLTCSTDRPEPVEGIIPAAVDTGSATLVALAAGAGPESATWTLDLRTSTWERMDPATAPDAALVPNLVYDPNGDVVLAWSNTDDRMWAYDLDADAWTRLAAGPDQRLEDAVYDPRSGQVILRDPASGSLWGYDPAADSWHRLPGEPGPVDETHRKNVLRFYSFMVADPTRMQLILTQATGYPVGRTWTFDLKTHRWTRLDARPPVVSAGYFESGREIVVDDATDEVLLMSNDVLAAFDPATQRWRTIDLPIPEVEDASPHVLAPGPLARLGHTLVYDPVNRQVLLLGGKYRAVQPPGWGWSVACDVWTYETSPNTWTELPAAGQG